MPNLWEMIGLPARPTNEGKDSFSKIMDYANKSGLMDMASQAGMTGLTLKLPSVWGKILQLPEENFVPSQHREYMKEVDEMIQRADALIAKNKKSIAEQAFLDQARDTDLLKASRHLRVVK